jgi:hypothetical protein
MSLMIAALALLVALLAGILVDRTYSRGLRW